VVLKIKTKKLFWLIVGFSILILIFLFLFLKKEIFYESRIKHEDENIRILAEKVQFKIDQIFYSVKDISSTICDFIEFSQYTEDDLNELLKSVVEYNDEIFGCSIAFEPNAFKKDSLLYGLYYFKYQDTIYNVKLGNIDYNYFEENWYLIPKLLQKPMWSEPFNLYSILQVSYKQPLYEYKHGKEIFKGVVSLDISLEWLNKIISSIKILKSGYCILVSKFGTFIVHPNKDWILNESIFSVAGADDPELRETGRKIINGESGFFNLSHKFIEKDIVSSYTSVSDNDGKKTESIVEKKERKWRLFYTPIKMTNWSLLIVYPEDELE
jgi:phosphoserine phosphatase RsbU/P